MMPFLDCIVSLVWRVSVVVLLSLNWVVEAAPVPVRVKPLSELVTHRQYRAPATVISVNDSQISAEVSARIVAIFVRVGDPVAAGTVMVQLDDHDLVLLVKGDQARVDALSARLDLARYQLSRAITLSHKQAVSEELLKQRQSGLAALQADLLAQQVALKLSRSRLEKARVRAPFNAVISERLGQLGQFVVPGTPLLRMIDAENLEVTARIQPDLAVSLRSAVQPVLVVGKRSLPLTLSVVVPRIDTKQRTRQVRLQFSGDAALVGQSGELVWADVQDMLPADLLLHRGDTLGIFIIRKGQAVFVPIDGAEEGRLAVRPVLPDDSQIVIHGHYRLRDGDVVELQ